MSKCADVSEHKWHVLGFFGAYTWASLLTVFCICGQVFVYDQRNAWIITAMVLLVVFGFLSVIGAIFSLVNHFEG